MYKPVSRYFRKLSYNSVHVSRYFRKLSYDSVHVLRYFRKLSYKNEHVSRYFRQQIHLTSPSLYCALQEIVSLPQYLQVLLLCWTRLATSCGVLWDRWRRGRKPTSRAVVLGAYQSPLCLGGETRTGFVRLDLRLIFVY